MGSVTLQEFLNLAALPNCRNYTGSKTSWCPASHIAGITKSSIPQSWQLKHLGENIKNPAVTNPAFTGASHFAGIPKSGIAKLPQLLQLSDQELHLPPWHSFSTKMVFCYNNYL
jgi:hypothetical protein